MNNLRKTRRGRKRHTKALADHELLRDDIEAYMRWVGCDDKKDTYVKIYVIVSLYAGAIMQFVNNKAAISLNTNQPESKLTVNIII